MANTTAVHPSNNVVEAEVGAVVGVGRGLFHKKFIIFAMLKDPGV